MMFPNSKVEHKMFSITTNSQEEVEKFLDQKYEERWELVTYLLKEEVSMAYADSDRRPYWGHSTRYSFIFRKTAIYPSEEG